MTACHDTEIAYFDRGPLNAERMEMAGSWSVYWYNGLIVNSEIARGLDILELVPSEVLTQNEIDAANSVRLDQLNSQGQPIFEWPATFALARAYVDQLVRSGGLSTTRLGEVLGALSDAESSSGADRRNALRSLADGLAMDSGGSTDAAKVDKLANAVQRLAEAG